MSIGEALPAGGQGFSVLAPVGRVAGFLAVHHVGGDGEDGKGVPGLAVQAVLAQSVVELLRLLASDLVHPSSSLLPELGEVAFDFKIGDQAGFGVGCT